MVVRQNYRGSVSSQCQLHHLPRVHARLGQGSSEQLFGGKHSVLRIQQHDDEYLVLAVMQE
jgi:hypothetical protein